MANEYLFHGRDSGVAVRRSSQARLKRIEAQLASLRGEGGSAVAMYPPSAIKVEPVPQPFPGAYDGADRRPDMYTAPAPPKRKASDLSRHAGEVKRLKSGGEGGGDQRLAPSGRLRTAYAHCERTLDFLMKDPASIAYFNVPVDYITLGAACPACPKIISARVYWWRRFALSGCVRYFAAISYWIARCCRLRDAAGGVVRAASAGGRFAYFLVVTFFRRACPGALPAAGIPLYPQIITNPMDLGTIKGRCACGEAWRGSAARRRWAVQEWLGRVGSPVAGMGRTTALVGASGLAGFPRAFYGARGVQLRDLLRGSARDLP
jgi:hypothetical protein